LKIQIVKKQKNIQALKVILKVVPLLKESTDSELNEKDNSETSFVSDGSTDSSSENCKFY